MSLPNLLPPTMGVKNLFMFILYIANILPRLQGSSQPVAGERI